MRFEKLEPKHGKWGKTGIIKDIDAYYLLDSENNLFNIKDDDIVNIPNITIKQISSSIKDFDVHTNGIIGEDSKGIDHLYMNGDN